METDHNEQLEAFLRGAKEASRTAAGLSGAVRNRLLNEMADALITGKAEILRANALDTEAAAQNGMAAAMLDRLVLNDKRVAEMAQALREIAALRDPLGVVIDGWVNDDELRIEKVSVPIGVIAAIYESRPNVTADVAALCLKSGNAAILKGGKEARHSNEAISEILRSVLRRNQLSEMIISLLPDSSHEGVKWLIRQNSYVDLIVPRGGEGLIKFVSENASVPVVKHDKGVCHLYIHSSAEYEMSERIAINAKVQRPSACNAIETLLIDSAIAAEFLPKLQAAFEREKTELRGCELTRGVINVGAADERDWQTEYQDNILSIKVVSGVDEAIAHIHAYGSSHSEAIIARENGVIERFLHTVDAACVYANASTRFTDGGQFGFGAEVGISTNKLHARGPMGVRELTTYKYRIYGKGQTRG